MSFDVFTRRLVSFAAAAWLAAPLGAADQARIDGSQRYVFLGQTACVCGHFPTDRSQSGLLLGEIPLEGTVSASASRVDFRVPDGVAPGRYSITGSETAGFAPGSGSSIEVLQLAGSLDRELLRSGQATPMRIRILGTEDRLELRLTNETPEIISIEGGDDGVVLTSGGPDNTVDRIVRGLKPGDFNITYGVADDPCPCGPAVPSPAAASDERADRPLVRRGYPLPAAVTVVGRPVGTGRTTGHIATLSIANGGDEPIVFPDRAVYIPVSNPYQGYVVPGGGGTTVPPGATREVAVEGYCGDVRRPPVPAGEGLPGIDEWIVPVAPVRTVPVTTARTGGGAARAGAALVPGTDRPLPSIVDQARDPRGAAPYLWGAVEAIAETVERLQREGELRTPFSSDRERERQAVVQQTLWRYAGELSGEPYTREEFRDRLREQYEERTGIAAAAAPEEDRRLLEEGSDRFWDAFELVGVEAKVLISEEETADTVGEPEQASEEAEESPCDIDKRIQHSEPGSDFEMSESYKDGEKRANLKEWFDDLPDPTSDVEGGTFEAGTYPASAWAVAGRDFVGGYCNAVAKHVFQEAGGGTDWVWTTELLEVEARSEGTHTVKVTPPPGGECETLVVGAAGGLVKAWSNAIDPIAESRGIVEALRVVRDVAIIVASATAAPFTAGASIAVGVGVLAASKAFDAEFSSDANAAAAVEGKMRLQVKDRWIVLDANSRSSVSGSGDIESDEAKVAKGQTSAQDPSTLTATTEGFSALKARAEDNGVAEGTIESQIGITIVGFCICDGDVRIEYLIDSGLFLAEEGAAGTATRVRVELEEKLNDVIGPYAEMDADEIIPSARESLPGELEAMLQGWYQDNAGRFNLPAE